ncbi:NAD(P)/FAD-dependent oxidoreductase [Chachezhania antarctica]|uniref:NAD(P)/FAD-dependent oxidoreductase n=1 Tax=Chachezhania antarctica TaxID=2340860 RepID=UPI000EB58101|nr:FAD-dependent oxidoreductase [Chachezhania antarctica]
MTEFDVIIIGAGPAGLSAATELKRLGVARVLVLERERDAGGIPRHCLHSPYGMREWHRVMFGPAYARRLVDEAREAGAEIRCQTTVTALRPGGEVEVSSPDGVHILTGRAVLLATGARETPRAARLVGGTKPGGVMNTATLQGFATFSGGLPFKRPVIVGTELVSFSALVTCLTHGARPSAMIESGARPTARAVMALAPRLMGVPLRFGTTITAIHGRTRVEAVTLDTPEGAQDIQCDGVVFTGGFRPENALLRNSPLAVDAGSLGPRIDQYGRLSDPAYFAAGNVLHAIETAGWCWNEGRRVARTIDAALRGALPPLGSTLITAKADTDAIKFALPQVLSASDPSVAPAFDRMQLRLSRAYRGDIVMGSTTHRVESRPERRILLPLPRVTEPGP